MNINKILDQMEATIELWENFKGDYKDSYLEFRYEETKTLYNFINVCKNTIERKQQRIDKALELIYKNAYSEDRKELVDELWYEIPELVAILKGDENNEH